ncbi:peptidoglycan-binding protein [Streptomyces caeruleatus]|uniref:Peptidoglycan-binding protein n=1 Tax=Streptomyces caeruleatus TaxID=661399 RepID=A0A117RQU5_9ACTN|nr:peptidoglycan-binding protein [Streptomyces caeruleatus]
MGQNGHACPECGTPRAPDNTPSCGCGQRVSEALRDARTAEAAAAEDFDPLRIRPYVELEADGDNGAAALPADATMPLRPIPPAPAPAPSTRDLSLFEPDPDAGAPGTAATGHRRTRTVLLGAGGALVAVIAAAGLASGLFTYETPSRDTALPDDVRASVPAPSTSEASQPPAPTRTRSAPPPAFPTPTRSTSPSPSPSRSSASPAPSPSTEPTNTSAPSPTDAAGAQEESAAARDPAPPTLRRGDRGSEVVELELRLTQLGLYTREAGGSYNEGVEDAVSRYQWARGVQPEEYGVYDLATRERLESETQEP